MRARKRLDERRRAAESAARECVRVLKERFGAGDAFVFGSLRGDSPWHERSDIDIAVKGLPPEDYFRALTALERLLPPDMGLDLVTLEAASPRFAARAKGELEMPEEPKAALRSQIEDELAAMERMVEMASRFVATAPTRPSELELAGLGKHVHDFYTGAERIFERIAVRLSEPLPSGERWHVELLDRMQREIPGRRPAVIDQVLGARLLDYLQFRHRFRHIYGPDLDWDRLRPRVEGMPEVLRMLRDQLDRFLDALLLPRQG